MRSCLERSNASQFWNDAFIKLSRPAIAAGGTDRKKTRKSGSIGGDEDQSFCSSDEDDHLSLLQPLIPYIFGNSKYSHSKESTRPLPLETMTAV